MKNGEIIFQKRIRNKSTLIIYIRQNTYSDFNRNSNTLIYISSFNQNYHNHRSCRTIKNTPDTYYHGINRMSELPEFPQRIKPLINPGRVSTQSTTLIYSLNEWKLFRGKRGAFWGERVFRLGSVFQFHTFQSISLFVDIFSANFAHNHSPVDWQFSVLFYMYFFFSRSYILLFNLSAECMY